MDLVIGAEASNTVNVLLSNKQGRYTPAAGYPYTAGRYPRIAIPPLNYFLV
jgi:hypothetical protein